MSSHDTQLVSLGRMQDRIDDLSSENRRLARLADAAPDLLAALKALMPEKVCLTNTNVRDQATLLMDVEMGDLRRAAAAISKAERQS